MFEGFKDFFTSSIKSQEEGFNLMQRLLQVAHASSVFKDPVTSGDHTVITAAEVCGGVGFGYGYGAGSGPRAEADGMADAEEGQEEGSATGAGGGGGGCGGSIGRPIAVITIGPHGVEVQPVMDPTKIALAFITMLGSVLMFRKKMVAK